MKFKNISVMNFDNAFRGMRNPKESYDRGDTKIEVRHMEELKPDDVVIQTYGDYALVLTIGPNDMRLAQTLIKAGPEHRKFMRQIFVSVDITAPLYWWKEFDTYKVGTVANSTSTMHTIQKKPITFDCFECDDMDDDHLTWPDSAYNEFKTERLFAAELIDRLEVLRTIHNELAEALASTSVPESDRPAIFRQMNRTWKTLIRWLPESWLQTRTVTMNYENLLGMCSKGQRRFHKLEEWSGRGYDGKIDTEFTESFIKFARSLPFAQELIFIDENTDQSSK